MKINSLEFSHRAWSSDRGVWQVTRPHAGFPIRMLLSARALAGQRRSHEVLDWETLTCLAVGLSPWPHFEDLRLQEATQPSCFSSTVPLVIQPWPGFSKATQGLRTIRPWVRIGATFPPKLLLIYFIPQPLQSLSWGPQAFAWQLLSLSSLGSPGPHGGFHFLTRFHSIAHTSASRPHPGAPLVCFSWSRSAVITPAFSGTLQVVERGFICVCVLFFFSFFFPVIIALSSNFD